MFTAALHGYIGSGKDYIGQKLSDLGYGKVVKFADKVRDQAYAYYGLDVSMKGNREYEAKLLRDIAPDFENSYLTVRKAMVRLAQIYRSQDNLFYVKALVENIRKDYYGEYHPDKGYIVTDLRYPWESQFLEIMGARLIRVENPFNNHDKQLENDSEQHHQTLIEKFTHITYINDGTTEPTQYDLHKLMDCDYSGNIYSSYEACCKLKGITAQIGLKP